MNNCLPHYARLGRGCDHAKICVNGNNLCINLFVGDSQGAYGPSEIEENGLDYKDYRNLSEVNRLVQGIYGHRKALCEMAKAYKGIEHYKIDYPALQERCTSLEVALSKSSAEKMALEIKCQAIEEKFQQAEAISAQRISELAAKVEDVTQQLAAAKQETEEARQAQGVNQENMALFEAKIAEQVEIIDGLQAKIVTNAEEHALELEQAKTAFQARFDRIFTLLERLQTTTENIDRNVAVQRYGDDSTDSEAC